MANTNEKQYDRSRTYKVDAAFDQALNRVRDALKPKPSRSEIIRRLVHEADAKNGKRRT